MLNRLKGIMDLPEFKIQVFPIKNKLYRLAKRLLGDHEDAQDMIQEVFIRLWGMREKLNEYRSIEAFSVVMTRNICLDKIKSKKLPVEKMEGLEARLGAMDEEAPEDHSHIIGKIHQIIRTLPEMQQTVIQLRDVEGCEIEEIAEMMEMNKNAIRVNLSRARKRVREILIKKKLYEYQRN